jgi:putative heme-binding domain-containing protein
MQRPVCRTLDHAVITAVCGACLFLSQSAAAQQAQAAKPSAPAQKQPALAGRQIFDSNCAGCHGLDGRGGERGPDISTRPQIVQLPDEDLRAVVQTGRPAAGMPPFASLGTRIDGLVAYLRFLQGASGVGVETPGDAAKGKALFFGKGRCSECHMVQGQGGFLGRDLSTYGVMSAKEIRKNIENAGGNVRMRTVKMRSSQEITGVVRNEDNFSMQLQSPDGSFHLVSRSDIAAIETLPEPVMPANYAKLLSDAEFEDLVKFLVTVAKGGARDSASEDEE